MSSRTFHDQCVFLAVFVVVVEEAAALVLDHAVAVPHRPLDLALDGAVLLAAAVVALDGDERTQAT
jgi:hypothetical protein